MPIQSNKTIRDGKEVEKNEMKYRVHQIEVKKDTAQEKLERFLNQLEGDVVSIVPYVTPTFQGMGATAKVDFLLIVEKVT
jgi:hypothetical protein